MGILLAVLAIICAVFGVVSLLDGHILVAILWFIAACALGPGGWNITSRR